jgi:hypothetical protein
MENHEQVQEDSVLQESDHEDSPNTSKIKNVVDRRIGEIFGEAAVAPRADAARSAASGAALSEAQKISAEMERLRGMLSKEPRADRMRARPGLPRNFVAEEMDRASSMMASVFRKAGSL